MRCEVETQDDMPTWLLEAVEAMPTPPGEEAALPASVLSGSVSPTVQVTGEVRSLLKEKAVLEALLREAHAQQCETSRMLEAAHDVAEQQRRKSSEASDANVSLRLRLERAAAQIERLEAESALGELRLCARQQSEAEALEAALAAEVSLDASRKELARARDELRSALEANTTVRDELLHVRLHTRVELAGGRLGKAAHEAVHEKAAVVHEKIEAVHEKAAKSVEAKAVEAKAVEAKGGSKGTPRRGLTARAENSQTPTSLATTPGAKPGELLRHKLAQLEAAIAQKENELTKACAEETRNRTPRGLTRAMTRSSA